MWGFSAAIAVEAKSKEMSKSVFMELVRVGEK
jgi:hypothetical protein